MASTDLTFSWPASGPDFDPRSRHVGNYTMDVQAANHQAMHSGPGTALVPVCTDVKPRLTKDQHEILEQHFSAQPKPSTSTKKGFADILGVSLDKINNWFQNRRAKVKQDQKKTLNAMQMYQAHLAQHSQQYLGHPQSTSSNLPQYFGPLPVVPSNNTQVATDSIPLAISDGPSPHMIPLPPSRDGLSAPLEYGMQAPVMGAALEGGSFGGHQLPTGMGDSPMLFGNGFAFQQPFPSDYYNLQFEQQVDTQGIPNVIFQPSPMSATPHSVPIITSAFSQVSQLDEEKTAWVVDSPQDSAMSTYSSSHPTPADSTTTAPTTDFYEDQKSMTAAMNAEHGSPASTEALSESLDGILDSSTSETGSPTTQPAQASGLAARRQRQRPANLAPNALRSASYSPGVPASPSAHASDQLRRIKSGGLATAGRISKTPNPQKSPSHAHFDVAALASPKFRAQHASNNPGSSSSCGPLTATTNPGGLAPPTPITPNGLGRLPSWQHPAGRTMHPNGSPSAFSYTGDDAMFIGASPPSLGQLDMQQYEQLRTSLAARQEALFNTPPQSAPAFRQQFGLTPPYANAVQSSNLHGKPSAHARHPSLPENYEPQTQGQWHAGPLVHPSEAPVPFNAQLAVGYHPDAMTMADTIAMQAACGPSAFAYPYVNGQVFNKPNLHFQNHGPEDFQNGQRPR